MLISPNVKWWTRLESNQLPAVALCQHSTMLLAHIEVGVAFRSNLRYLSNFLPPAATLGIIGGGGEARTLAPPCDDLQV